MKKTQKNNLLAALARLLRGGVDEFREANKLYREALKSRDQDLINECDYLFRKYLP